ncbi:hypothetical protein COLO4_06527 [Corchorus olitorius]|uniref:Uncharacterized protein n=1 Tax=Corchorus olitorius TaxID=93759 RepID=A0A1R3KMT8_9ROSI|nr:hypothetical protein COLO4_06527 [Corchorus olitorius]
MVGAAMNDRMSGFVAHVSSFLHGLLRWTLKLSWSQSVSANTTGEVASLFSLYCKRCWSFAVLYNELAVVAQPVSLLQHMSR